MKKILAILIAMLMVFSLTACGGDSPSDSDNPSDNNEPSDSNEPADSSDPITDDAAELIDFESFSVEAVEYYLSKAVNIKLSDLEPDWEHTVKENHAYADDPASGYGHATIIFSKPEGEVTPDEYNAWLEKVFNATAAVSQDGYNIIGYEFVGDGEDALSQTTLEDAMSGFMKGWGFKYNDKLMVVYVDQKYDNSKESEIGELFYYYGVNVDIGVGLQKSFSDTMSEVEDYFEENEDAIKDAVEDFFN